MKMNMKSRSHIFDISLGARKIGLRLDMDTNTVNIRTPQYNNGFLY